MKTDSQKVRRLPLLLLALLALLLAGAAAANGLRIVVSIPPYADLLARLAGPEAEVAALLPPGAGPHGFEPSPRAVARLEGADLVVLNGGVDAWMERLVASVGVEVPSVVVTEVLAEAHEEGPAAGAADGGGGDESAGPADAGGAPDGHDHGAGGLDPHVWLDPTLVVEAVPALAAALAAADPAGAAGYEARAAALVADLEALDAELATRLAPVAGAPFVPFHDAWAHFAARYGLDLLLEIEPFPGREPSARELAEAIDAVRASGARAVFAESQLSERAARVLAAEAGVAVVVLDPLGGVPGREGYEALLRYNAERIVGALSDE